MKLQRTQKFEGVTPENVFKTAKSLFEEMGMEIIKVRSFAFFLQAKTKGGGDLIDANFMVSSFQNEFSLTLISETVSMEKLETFAADYLNKFEHYLHE